MKDVVKGFEYANYSPINRVTERYMLDMYVAVEKDTGASKECVNADPPYYWSVFSLVLAFWQPSNFVPFVKKR